MQVKLTDRFVKTAAPGRYADLGCSQLALHVVGNSRLWFFVRKENGKRIKAQLGSYPDMGLEQAREACNEARRRWKQEGIDPKTHKAAEQTRKALEAAKDKTFDQVRAEFIAVRSVEEGWSEKYTAGWVSMLTRFATPAIGELPISGIAKPHVMQVLAPLFKLPKREIVRQVHGKIKMILNYAQGLDYRETGNPVSWDVLVQVYGKGKGKKVEHHAAVPYAEMADAMDDVRNLDGDVGPLALEFTILTNARGGESTRAEWSEIKDGVWTVPANRMKARKLHRVPLTAAALAVLEKMKGRHPCLVFPGDKPGKPITVDAMWFLIKKLRPVTTHGFRSTFRDWAGDTTSFPRELIEHAMAHVVGEASERAYHRSDMLEKRRELMEAWADYCNGDESDESNVVPIRRKA